MRELWIKKNGKARGPYTLEAIGEMLRSGELQGDDGVWDADRNEWLTADWINKQEMSIHPLPKAQVERRTASVGPGPTEGSDPELAGLWRRFFARIFDLWFCSILLVTPCLFVLVYYYPNAPLSYIINSDFLFPVCVAFVAFLFDSILYALFGNTPGKALLGIKVVPRTGTPFSFNDYMLRNGVWVKGLFLGIPIFNIIGMLVQRRNVKKFGCASYDEDDKTLVVVRCPSFTKTVVFVVLFMVLITASTILKKHIRKLLNCRR